MKRKKQKYQSITVRISEEERRMANELRDKYYIRISRIVGDAIKDYWKYYSMMPPKEKKRNEQINR